MAVSRRGQGSFINSYQKNAKLKRNGHKTRLLPVPAKTGKTHPPKAVEETSKTVQCLLYVLVAAAASSCYIKTLFGDLVHDDIFAIKYNADIKPETPIMDLFSHDYWGESLQSPFSHKSFRPLCILSFRAQFLLHGLKPFGYRLVNVSLHVLVSLLFVRLCETVLSCSKVFSFMNGLLFAVHPIHSEAVNGVVGRADILACLLFLLAFKSYANCIQCSTQKLVDKNENKACVSKSLRSHCKYLMVCIILGAAAMLAKENGITVFGVCVLYDIMVNAQWHLVSFNRSTKGKSSKMDSRLLIRIIILTLVVLFLLYFRLILQNGKLPQFSADENPASHSDSCLTRLLTYTHLCFVNAWLLLVPLTLCYDWQMGSIPLVESLFDLRNLATIIFFAILLGLFVLSVIISILKNQERKILLTGLLFLTIPFLPASNILFPVGFVIAERILYIPSLGYCVVINFGFAKLAGISISGKDQEMVVYTKTTRFKVTTIIFLLMVCLFSLKTWQQSTVWQTRETLFRSGVHAQPQNAKVHFNYANYLKDVKRNAEAIHHYQISLKLAPGHASSHNNLGTLLEDSEEGIKHFKLALKYDPHHANALLNLGALLSMQNRLDESEKYLRESLRQNEQSGSTLMILADVLSKQGHIDEADELYKQSLMKTPDDATLCNNYGMFLARNGQFREALFYYDKAAILAPKYSFPVINKVQVLQALGKYQVAEFYLKKFFEETKDPAVLHELGILYYKLNRFSDAEKVWHDALKIDPTLTDTLFNYGILLTSLGHKDKAFQVLQHCLKTRPNSIQLNKDIIAILHDMQYLTEALEAVENALTIFNECYFYYQKGNILKDLGEYQEAIKAYKAAIKLDPTFTDVYLNLGAVHHVLRNLDAAKVYYNYVLTLDPFHKVAKKNLEKLTMV